MMLLKCLPDSVLRYLRTDLICNLFDSFAAIIRKYVGITELTPTIVNEFIKKIVVHAPEKIDGKRFQKVDIIFNFVGEIHLPTDPQTEQKEANKQEKTA